MYNQTVREGKTMAIVSYITFIGTLIAFIVNQNKNNSFTSFHIRQAIGLILLGAAIKILNRYLGLDLISYFLSIGVIVLWIIGLIGAVQGEEKRVPLLGDKFQEWFRNIG